MGKTGLVVEGGGTRGIYAAGVLDVFLERGIWFDGVIGVSAGAIHGCSFVANQPGRSARYYLACSRDPRFFSKRSLLMTGSYVGTQFCYRDIPERVCPFDHDAFEASETEFYLTCTDVETGEAYYRLTRTLRGDAMDALRASASLPMLSRPVSLDGRVLLDGGVADSIPLEAFERLGFERCVVVLTQPAGYRKKMVYPWIARMMYRSRPAFLEAIRTRHIRYNATLDEVARQEESGECVALRPSRELRISRLERDPETILEMYELGRCDAQSKLGAVKAFLA